MRGRIKINAEERRSLNSDNRIEIYLLGTSLQRNEELKGRLGGAREQGGREGTGVKSTRTTSSTFSSHLLAGAGGQEQPVCNKTPVRQSLICKRDREFHSVKFNIWRPTRTYHFLISRAPPILRPLTGLLDLIRVVLIIESWCSLDRISGSQPVCVWNTFYLEEFIPNILS